MAFSEQSSISPDPPDRERRRLACVRLVLLAAHYGVSDEQALSELADRLSWRRFCGLGADEPAIDADELEALRPTEADLVAEAPTGMPSGTARRRPQLSIVSPVYRAEELVDELVRRLVAAAGELTSDFEIILVDDGSPDGSWQHIAAAARSDPRIKGLRLTRNFGQHLALTAGLDRAAGEYVAVLDCDLQDDPLFLGRLWAKAREGYDIVYTRRARRAHGAAKNFGARLFAAVLNRLAAGRLGDPAIGSYSMLSGRAVAAFRRVRDVHRHYLLVLRWLGFPTATVEIEHRPRPVGKSSYDLHRLLRHAVDGLTSQSDRLLYLALAGGLVFLVGALAAASWVVVGYFRHGFREGWASTVVIVLLATSAILLGLGVVGVYVGKVFDQVKQRPLYLVQEALGLGGPSALRDDSTRRA